MPCYILEGYTQNDFVIVTDSSCDLPNDLVQKLELHVVPLAFIMGDKTYWNYPDNREMSPEDFYGRQKQGQMATTNAVNVGQATDVLEPILKQGQGFAGAGLFLGTFHYLQLLPDRGH